jgi:predicted NACHT family NTPase
VDAWRLPPAARRKILVRVKDPAIAALARVPLLLALLCSLAARLPDRDELPATRGQLYERVLRWF